MVDSATSCRMNGYSKEIQRYWELEAAVCRAAAALGLKKADMLADPSSLPYSVRDEVEKMPLIHRKQRL